MKLEWVTRLFYYLKTQNRCSGRQVSKRWVTHRGYWNQDLPRKWSSELVSDGPPILSNRPLVWKLIYLMSSFVRVFRIWFTATFLIKFTTWVVWIRLSRVHFIPLKYFGWYNPENAREWNKRDWSNSCWFAVSAGNHETFRL